MERTGKIIFCDFELAGYQERTFYNCPVDGNIFIYYVHNSKPPCIKVGNRKMVLSNTLKDEINNFLVYGKVRTDELVELFIEILGLIPLFGDHKDAYGCVKFRDVEDYRSRRKSIQYVTLLDVSIPNACLLKMSTVIEMCDDLNIKHHELTLEHFPDYLQPHLTEALELLNRSNFAYTVDVAAVYEYLGILDMLFESDKFIHGDELIEFTEQNMVSCGYSHKTVKRISKGIFVDFRLPHNETLVTDEIIKYSTEYKNIMTRFPRPHTKMQITAFQLFLRTYGKN